MQLCSDSQRGGETLGFRLHAHYIPYKACPSTLSQAAVLLQLKTKVEKSHTYPPNPTEPWAGVKESDSFCFACMVTLFYKTKHETNDETENTTKSIMGRLLPCLGTSSCRVGRVPLSLLLLLFNCTFSFTFVHGRHSHDLSASPSLPSLRPQ